jgi:hypothetical protein
MMFAVRRLWAFGIPHDLLGTLGHPHRARRCGHTVCLGWKATLAQRASKMGLSGSVACAGPSPAVTLPLRTFLGIAALLVMFFGLGHLAVVDFSGRLNLELCWFSSSASPSSSSKRATYPGCFHYDRSDSRWRLVLMLGVLRRTLGLRPRNSDDQGAIPAPTMRPHS